MKKAVIPCAEPLALSAPLLSVARRPTTAEMMLLITGVTTHPFVLPSYLPPDDQAGRTQHVDAPALQRSKRGVAKQDALWPQFATLKISLMGMTKAQEKFTQDNINKWAPYINLKLEFTDKPGGDIRIQANNDVDGGYSYYGTEGKGAVGANEATMEIGFLGGLNTFNARTVQHEFGHALGLHHEHQHPENTLEFDLEWIRKDYKDRKEPGDIDDNFAPVNPKEVITSAYDQASIMHYSFPEDYLKRGEAIEASNELSEGDKAFARSLYPRPKPPASFRWHRFVAANHEQNSRSSTVK